jgi:hypothetical protein
MGGGLNYFGNNRENSYNEDFCGYDQNYCGVALTMKSGAGSADQENTIIESNKQLGNGFNLRLIKK